ncbi:hypothetical protein LS71_001520 [Helicobacter jaachi]|uniref:Integral membrane protein n=1 Tax=Helicobacter jaachi TaxID=1677920 RepID=A0A4U8TFF1_9HELI|nr:hypothetical protein [Helicobacter jaachi]TLD97457.1 hypothetical protein LS71_001520 [Helicobacter jaachi]
MVQARFYIGIILCALGWIFIGLGVLLFPLSLFFIMRAKYHYALFVFLVIINVAGFSLSLYANAQFIAKQIL